MKLGSSHTIVDNKVLVLVTIVLILNTVLAGLNFNMLYTQFTDNNKEEIVLKQVRPQDLLEYNRRLSQELGVKDRASVKEALASFSYEIDMAQDSDEMARLIFTHGRQVQETILRSGTLF